MVLGCSRDGYFQINIEYGILIVQSPKMCSAMLSHYWGFEAEIKSNFPQKHLRVKLHQFYNIFVYNSMLSNSSNVTLISFNFFYFLPKNSICYTLIWSITFTNFSDSPFRPSNNFQLFLLIYYVPQEIIKQGRSQKFDPSRLLIFRNC